MKLTTAQRFHVNIFYKKMYPTGQEI